MNESSYKKLSQINVNDKIEKKNGLSYLSWAFAVGTLLEHDPMATWTYGEPVRWNDTVMVFCTVTAFGKAMTAQLPVMDYKNKAIPNPDAFAVNTAMQRCLAKAIALHGLGLYIYAGEDVPDAPKGGKITPLAGAWDNLDAEEVKFLEGVVEKVQKYDNDPEAAYAYLESQKLDNEEKMAVWAKLDSKLRAAIKKVGEARK